MIDALQVFDGTISSAGVLAGAAITVTRASTNVLDMLAARDVGAGVLGLEVHVNVITAFTTGDAAVLQIFYETSADNVTFVQTMESPLYAVANLVVGAKIFRYGVPDFQLNDTGTPNRYHRLTYTVTVGSFTAGTVFAYINAGGDREEIVTYPRGYAVG